MPAAIVVPLAESIAIAPSLIRVSDGGVACMVVDGLEVGPLLVYTVLQCVSFFSASHLQSRFFSLTPT